MTNYLQEIFPEITKNIKEKFSRNTELDTEKYEEEFDEKLEFDKEEYKEIIETIITNIDGLEIKKSEFHFIRNTLICKPWDFETLEKELSRYWIELSKWGWYYSIIKTISNSRCSTSVIFESFTI